MGVHDSDYGVEDVACEERKPRTRLRGMILMELGVRDGDNGVDDVANEMCVTNNFFKARIALQMDLLNYCMKFCRTKNWLGQSFHRMKSEIENWHSILLTKCNNVTKWCRPAGVFAIAVAVANHLGYCVLSEGEWVGGWFPLGSYPARYSPANLLWLSYADWSLCL